MEVYLANTEGNLCFKHAVKKAIKGAGDINLKAYDNSDCGESGYWWLGDCSVCTKQTKDFILEVVKR